MNKIGIIGAGKVGVSIGKAWNDIDDLEILGYYSRTKASSDYAAQSTSSISFDGLEDLVNKCNVIIITSPDDSIEEIWRRVSIFNIQNKIVAHCSGSLSSEIFFDSSLKGASVCSIHPVLAISSKENSYQDLKKAFFTLEGDKVATDFFVNIFRFLGNPHKVIKTCDKVRYHISTVFMSNLVIGLSSMASNLFREYGFTGQEALLALSMLAKNNMENVFENGVVDALTGPVERNDASTVSRHLKSLESNHRTREIYRLLSLELVEIASRKNCDRDYKTMKNLLSKEGDQV